ncbi:hypothetical protein ScPMuIL_000919 [Solemya velum]
MSFCKAADFCFNHGGSVVLVDSSAKGNAVGGIMGSENIWLDAFWYEGSPTSNGYWLDHEGLTNNFLRGEKTGKSTEHCSRKRPNSYGDNSCGKDAARAFCENIPTKGAVPPSSYPACQAQWCSEEDDFIFYAHLNTCYSYIADKLDVCDALAYCSEIGGHLPAIDTKDKKKAIQRMLENIKSEYGTGTYSRKRNYATLSKKHS